MTRKIKQWHKIRTPIYCRTLLLADHRRNSL